MTINLTSSAMNVTTSIQPWLYEPYSLKILRLVLVGFLATLGLHGNAWVIYQIRKQRSPLSCYICNLAVADMGVLAFSFPIAVIKEQLPTDWPLGTIICHYLYPLTEVFHGASIWSIAAIAAERYRGIRQIRISNITLHGKGTHVR